MKFILGLINLIGNFFSWFRDRDLRNQGKAQAEKEITENTLAEVQRREERVNAEPKTSYDGRPDRLRNWLRQKNRG